MTIYKTSELSFPKLDMAVANAEGLRWEMDTHISGDKIVVVFAGPSAHRANPYSPSCWWSDGGAIIQRARIGLIPQEDGNTWLAKVAESDWIVGGATALEAAMRAYVVAKLGEEVELP